MSVKRYLGTILAAGAAILLAALPAAAQKKQLTVYTALENDQLAPFKAAIEAAVPDVEVVWVRDSTGVITARFLAEKDNPRADLVMGLAATSLLMFEKQGLLEAGLELAEEAVGAGGCGRGWGGRGWGGRGLGGGG